ncbi:MAG: permease-like cell division protein FtsX [Candidatus Peribacteraceae bacterium]|nr:permease-like cell division protein FtsX [Candidatus Peribacteraceae bacterium]
MPSQAGLSSSWIRGVKRGVNHALRGEGSFIAIGALLGIFVLVQILLVSIVGTKAGLSFLRERLDLRIEVRDTATDAEVQDFMQAVDALPSVADIVFITREQALERQKQRDPTLVDFLVKFGIDNPFPDTVGVRLKRLEDASAFLTFIQAPAYAAVVNPAFLSETTDQQKQAEKLSTIVASTQALLWAGVGLIVLILLLVIIEYIRRRSLLRREEILIRQLAGTPMAELSLPFFVEMTCFLTLALTISLVITMLFLLILPLLIPALANGGIFAPWTQFTVQLLKWWSPWIILGEIAAVLALSVGGTFFALSGTIRAVLRSMVQVKGKIA